MGADGAEPDLGKAGALPAVTPAPWQALRRHTDARIALGRAGVSLPTSAHLAFQLAHAEARDAVHLPFDAPSTVAQLRAAGIGALPRPLHSAAPDRGVYLQRPDRGRRLDARSVQDLLAWTAAHDAGHVKAPSVSSTSSTSSASSATPAASTASATSDAAAASRFDLAFVIADGLSARAVHAHALPLLHAVLARLLPLQPPWQLAPVAVVEQGRVAVGDEVGALLGADLVVVLLGERPGLSSPDSLGVYFTWAPRVGRVDAERNCISNVRAGGLVVDAAAARLQGLLVQSRRRRLSGVALKDDGAADRLAADAAATPRRDLLDTERLA